MRVTFDDRVTVHKIPNEDRKSDWIQAAIDRERFKQRTNKLEILLAPILTAHLIKMDVIIDMQGFIIQDEFVPKELAITNNGKDVHLYLFKPPIKFSKLSEKDKRQARWLERHHHGLPFSCGFIPLAHIDDILDLFIGPNNIVYVKGYQKKDYLTKYLLNEVVNLENDTCVNLVKANHNCIYHKNNTLCSKYNVEILMKKINIFI